MCFSKKISVILVVGLLIVSGCGTQSYVKISDEKISIEVAKTEEEMKQGLKNREELCDKCGMLFIFEEEDYRSFWMKDTQINLEMIFIDENSNVVNVLEAEPCTEDNCKSYKSSRKAKYVLEVNANKFGEDIIGEKVEMFYK